VIYLLYTLHILLSIFLILVVLLQQGKGADLSVFGGGATMTAFGARGATTMLHRLTVAGFVGFILTTLAIAYLKGNVEGTSVMKAIGETPAPASAPATTPATPAPDTTPATGTETPAAGAPAATAPASESAPAAAPEAAPEKAPSAPASQPPPSSPAPSGG
jgi:preprotein translocase subunit SecG